MYRQVAERAVGAVIVDVEAEDGWFLKKGATRESVVEAAEGAPITGTDRIGKLLLLHIGDDRPDLGLRFGMTGRLILGEMSAIDWLEYSPRRENPAWDRFALRLDDGRRLRISDPRRLGGVELDPDTSDLGPDAWTVTVVELRSALAGSRTALKAALLDQRRLAGLGNLLVDEALWRAGLDPARPAGELDVQESRRLARTVRSTVSTLARRGGSHRGDLHLERHRNGVCPVDGTPLQRRTIGGRTTYSCPLHQL